MVRRIGVQVALLAFALAIGLGIHAGNPAATVLTRALAALLVGFAVAQAAAWCTRLILRDYLRERVASIQGPGDDAAAPVAPAVATPVGDTAETS